jgi:hypothetical protein
MIKQSAFQTTAKRQNKRGGGPVLPMLTLPPVGAPWYVRVGRAAYRATCKRLRRYRRR